jgi:hypothetical protein
LLSRSNAPGGRWRFVVLARRALCVEIEARGRLKSVKSTALIRTYDKGLNSLARKGRLGSTPSPATTD